MKWVTAEVDPVMTVTLGKIGIWRHFAQFDGKFAAEIEGLGYGAAWLGGSPSGDLADAERLLDATTTLVAATGIVNIWKDDAATVAASYERIAAKHPDRFLLGIGIGHPEHTDVYQKPYDKIVEYLGQLDEAGVPREAVVLAALGPKVLKLSGERTGGAHPYLTTPEHTRQAREILGAGPLLAPEQHIVFEADPEKARAVARPQIKMYLGLSNYTNNWLRLGYTEEDIANGGSDKLVDALVLHGDAATIANGVRAHLEAGADHVNLQVFGDDPLPALRALAKELL
jgi:probable F420-dependent oxidoreductase